MTFQCIRAAAMATSPTWALVPPMHTRALSAPSPTSGSINTDSSFSARSGVCTLGCTIAVDLDKPPGRNDMHWFKSPSPCPLPSVPHSARGVGCRGQGQRQCSCGRIPAVHCSTRIRCSHSSTLVVCCGLVQSHHQQATHVDSRVCVFDWRFVVIWCIQTGLSSGTNCTLGYTVCRASHVCGHGTWGCTVRPRTVLCPSTSAGSTCWVDHQVSVPVELGVVCSYVRVSTRKIS